MSKYIPQKTVKKKIIRHINIWKNEIKGQKK